MKLLSPTSFAFIGTQLRYCQQRLFWSRLALIYVILPCLGQQMLMIGIRLHFHFGKLKARSEYREQKIGWEDVSSVTHMTSKWLSGVIKTDHESTVTWFIEHHPLSVTSFIVINFPLKSKKHEDTCVYFRFASPMLSLHTRGHNHVIFRARHVGALTWK